MQSTTNGRKMSSVASHFTPNTAASATSEPSQDALLDSAVPHAEVSAPESTLSTHAGPSAWQIPDWIQKEFKPHANLKKKRTRSKKLVIEEDELSREAAARFVHDFLNRHKDMYKHSTLRRFACSLALDHVSVLYPDVDTPFVDAVDVVHRLLPYHVFQHPKEDLDALVTGGTFKGKGKATNHYLHDEIKGREFLLM